MGRTVAIINQKGGTGKTTTAINLTACLAAGKKKTLLVDLDPQANATSGMGVNPKEMRRNIYHLLIEEPPWDHVLRHTFLNQLDIIPSNIELSGAEVELVSLPRREKRLKEALTPLQDLYEYIIIDSPPSLGLLTLNALVAASSVIIPLQCEYYALEGLGHLMTTVQLVRENLNPDIAVEGILLTMHDRRTILSTQVIEEVKRHFKGMVFRTIIPRNVRLSEAPSHGKPIIYYDINSPGAKAYISLARELIHNAKKRAG
jgi:chromosome partitioning protein